MGWATSHNTIAIYCNCKIYKTIIDHSWWKECCICLFLWCLLMFTRVPKFKRKSWSTAIFWYERSFTMFQCSTLKLPVITSNCSAAPWIPWSTQSSTGLTTGSQLVFCRRPIVFGTCYGFRRTMRWFGNRRPEKLSAVPFVRWQLIGAGWCPRTVCGCALKPPWWQDTGRVSAVLWSCRLIKFPCDLKR